MKETPMGWLRPVLRQHRTRIVVGSVAAAVQTAVSLTIPLLFEIAIDRAIPRGHLALLNALALGCLALAALNALAARVEVLTVGRVGQHTLHAVRCRLFAHMQRLPMDFYQRERSGGVVSRMVGDPDAASGLVSGGLIRLANNIATIAGIAVILIILDWRLALETLEVAPLLAVAVIAFQRKSSAAWRAVREASSEATVALHEAVSGAREIQVYRAQGPVLDRAGVINNRARRANDRSVVLGALFFPAVEFCSATAFAVVLGFGGPRVVDGQLQIGTLTAFLLYLGLLFGPIFGLSSFYDTVQSAFAGGRRIGAALAIEPAIRDAEHPAGLDSPRGDLRLTQVRFAYPGPDGEPGPEVLHGIDLAVPAGQTLALVGPSGAGKSTIASLLLRFNDPSAGRVTLDGIDLRRIRLADLRDAVSFVPQEGFLFSGTVADNIGLGRRDATRGQVEGVITALGAWPLIERLPDGLDTEVGGRGKRLASGERQIVALARAWLTDPAVLVLDEATSHLDAESEARVSHALARLREGRTTVIIAHRLSSVLDADQIAMITDGEVAETGTPADLLAAGGCFAKLYQRWTAANGDQPALR